MVLAPLDYADRMSETTKFNLGDRVTPLTGRYPGEIVDISTTPNGTEIYYVLSTNGRVKTWTAEGLKPTPKNHYTM